MQPILSRGPIRQALLATSAAFAVTANAVALDAVVSFSELMYHPRDGELEWVELHNMMSVDVDLSEWRLSGGIDFRFPDGTVLEGGGFLVIEGEGGGAGEKLGPFTGRLDNNGERIRLRNNSDRLMDEVDYGDSGRWPVAADGSGASLAKRSPRLPSELPESWTFSTESGGTPGLQNQRPLPLAGLQISEVSAANAPLFWVEIINTGPEVAHLGGLFLENPSLPVEDGRHVLEGRTLAVGQRLVFDENTLGFRVEDEGRLFFTSARAVTIFDAVRVKNRPLARLEGATHEARFFSPDTSTPGEPNTFHFRDEIVINEIMYHHRPQPRRAASPGDLELVALAGFGATWRYNQTGSDLGANWAQDRHPVGGGWQSGAGLIGFEFGALPEPIRTTLANPVENDPYVMTHYFEIEVTLTEAEVARLQDVELRHIIDDGAVIYVNGVEVARPCMAAGPVSVSTPADCLIRDATVSEPILISRDRFVAGENRVSVELHQNEPGSTDVVFGCALTARLAPEGTRAQEYAEIGEEWIELYNRGPEAVDLGGWTLDGTIAFEFPAETVMIPGDYLVVANDAAALAAKHLREFTIAGEFSGRLNNGHGYLKLEDQFQNPADELLYYDGGRWPAAADGEGSSLELRDPHADNSVPEAWAASDETNHDGWRTFTYRNRATPFPGTADPTTYHEFIFGLLDAGEILLDDISVIEDPAGSARELIQNGTFERDRVGNLPASWRLLGTHGLHRRSRVIEDPDGDGKVLHVMATGPMWHQQNQAETTLKAGGQFVTINQSRVYEISFRAKWLTGSPLLNTRLYFDRVAKTHVLAQPMTSGTPGAVNSTMVENLGPTIEQFGHQPARPAANAAVRVEAIVSDPDGVADVTLHWSRNGGSFNQVPMEAVNEDGRYAATISGQPNNTKVQFYLEAEDTLGAVATFPAAGRNSRALYRVGTRSGERNPAQHLEIVMLNSDESLLGDSVNQMSNYRFGATLIYEEEIFYDVGVRLKGSQRGRPDLNRRGFNIAFNADQKFRGVFDSIGLDRSGGWRFGRTFGQDEIIIWHFMNRAGGIPAQHNDLVFLDAPGVTDGSAQLQLARFSGEFLGDQYANGEEGSLHNYELIYYPTTTTGGPEGLKRPNPDNVSGVPIRRLGSDQEAYRYYFQLRNNQDRDDYSGIIGLCNLFSQSTNDMLANAPRVIDIDEWLRTFAAVSLAAVSDSYFNNSNAHNTRFYHRPSDGRMLLFPWDMDFAFILGATSSMTPNSDLTRLLGDPVNKRLYWGHVLDLTNRFYRSAYMETWVEHYEEFLTGQDISTLTSFIQQRGSFARGEVRRAVPGTGFTITTNDGEHFDSDANPVVLEGDGWVDVREIRLAGSDAPLPVTWTDVNSWRIEVPLGPGENEITLEAVEFDGTVGSSASINITNTGTVVAAASDNFVLTELMYHPRDPNPDEQAAGFTDEDEFEFLEFQNVGPSTVDAGGVTLAEGIEFTIPAGTQVASGQRLVIVSNLAGFAMRYGPAFPDVHVAGEYGPSGTALRNSGERLHVLAADGSSLADFTYNDNAPWPISADSDGYSLVPINPARADFDSANPLHWRSSSTLDGNPGESDAYSFAEWSAEHENVAALDDPEPDHLVALLEYATGRSPLVTEGHPAVVIDPTITNEFSFVIAIGADDAEFTGEVADDLVNWTSDGVVYLGTVNNGDGTRTVSFGSAEGLAGFARLRFSLP